MCIYTLKKQKLKEILKEVRHSTERPKLGVSGVKDTPKTNNDLGMSCYIQVEYNVFFNWLIYSNHVKLIFLNI